MHCSGRVLSSLGSLLSAQYDSHQNSRPNGRFIKAYVLPTPENNIWKQRWAEEMLRIHSGYAHCGEEVQVNHLVFVEKVKLGTFTSL